SRRRHTRFSRDWSSDVCSSDLLATPARVPAPSSLSGHVYSSHLLFFILFNQSIRQVDSLDSAIMPYALPNIVKLIFPLSSLSRRSEERRVGKECRSRGSPYQ